MKGFGLKTKENKRCQFKWDTKVFEKGVEWKVVRCKQLIFSLSLSLQVVLEVCVMIKCYQFKNRRVLCKNTYCTWSVGYDKLLSI